MNEFMLMIGIFTIVYFTLRALGRLARGGKTIVEIKKIIDEINAEGDQDE